MPQRFTLSWAETLAGTAIELAPRGQSARGG
jgi:hypothetical protein